MQNIETKAHTSRTLAQKKAPEKPGLFLGL